MKFTVKKIFFVSLLLSLSPFIIYMIIGTLLSWLFSCGTDGMQVTSCFRNGEDYTELVRSFDFLPFLLFITGPLGLVVFVIGFFAKAITDKKNDRV